MNTKIFNEAKKELELLSEKYPELMFIILDKKMSVEDVFYGLRGVKMDKDGVDPDIQEEARKRKNCGEYESVCEICDECYDRTTECREVADSGNFICPKCWADK